MGRPAYATQISGSCPPHDSNKEVTSMVDTTPASGKQSESSSASPSTSSSVSPSASSSSSPLTSEPAPANAQEKGNRRRRPHGPEAWEAVKPEIARLYLEENRRLKDVMEILGEQWGFWASPKMYKTKLTQWKFFKNNRQEDVANLLYLQRYRQAMGKESTFRRNGKPVNVAAYIRRKGLRPNDLIEVAQSGDLPPTLRCRTPPPSQPQSRLPPPPPMLPKMIEAPDDFLLQEAYLHWSLDSPLMPPQMDARYFKGLDKYHNSESMRSVTVLTHGCWLLSIGRMREGGAFCRQAFSMIHSVLDSSAQFAVYELLGSAARYPDLGIHRELWNYLAKYATRIGHVNSRLQRMIAAFAKHARTFGVEHNVDMLQWARRFSSSQSHGTFDNKPFDYTLIQPWDILPMDKSYYHRYYLSQASWQIDEIPTAAMPSLDEYEDPCNLRADLLLLFGNQTAWADERISATALKMMRQMPLDQPPRYLQFVCLYALAMNNRARCQGEKVKFSPDHKLAREYLRKAAEVQVEAWDRGKNYYETLKLLENWHLEAGDEEEAEATRLKREEECQEAFEALRI